jgi:hypothetical protein
MPRLLTFVHAKEEQFPIHVKTQWEKIIELQVNSSNTVSDVKTLIAGKTGIPLDQLRLKYAGKQIFDGEITQFLASGYSLTKARVEGTLISAHNIKSVRTCNTRPSE